jgi:RNA polymerase sigma-70 factor (ECF subfamily)
VERTEPRALQLAQIFSEHADFVWRSLRRFGLAPMDADDALQEVFLVVYRRLGEYEECGLIRAWLFTISRQVAGHYRRSQARTERKQQAYPAPFAVEDLDQHLARREAVDVVNAFLETLDESQRDVFYLADVDGLTAPEIAAAVNVNINTVYSRLRLARRRFEQMLATRAQGERSDE